MIVIDLCCFARVSSNHCFSKKLGNETFFSVTFLSSV